MVLTGVVDQHRRRVRLRRTVHQVLVEERLEYITAELQRGIAIELQRAQFAAAVVHLAVPPRPHHQVIAVVAAVAPFHCLVGMVGTPHVLLVPQALQPHGRHLQRCFRHHRIQRLALPEPVIGRMLNQLLPPGQLVHTGEARVVAGRTDAQEGAVVVVAEAGQRRALAALLGLHREIVEVDLAECTVVEPVVAHPAIDHRALRRSHLQCRMRVGQRHHHGEALVRRAEHADLAIALRYVLHQPVDGVPGIGGVVHLGVVQRPAQRPGHHVIAFGAVLAADVLEHADVTAVDEHLVALR